MRFEEYRADAIRQVKLSEARYADEADNYLPTVIARRWARAFEGEEVDLDEIANVLRDAEKEKNNYDLVFHAFCNDMRKMYRVLWQDFLSRSAGSQDG
jgi:hypothetical protein